MKLDPVRWTAKAVLIFVFTLLVSLAMLAQAPPSGDTFASSSTPRQNYGSWPLLAVQQGTNSYIQFNLSNIPANTSITKATLRLYIDAVGRNGQFDVYQIDSAWSESTLTYSNAPQLGSSATNGQPTTVSASSLNQFVLIDITSLVQQWINGTLPNNGIALSLTSSNGSFSFDSKESEFTSHEPELEITLAGGTGQQGPPGPQGPAGPQGAQGPQGIPGNLNPGSPYYIQNGTTAQSGASFNVAGSGTVGGTLAGQLVNSTTGYQVGGTTQFNANSVNDLILGANAGNSTMTGAAMQIIGDGAGQSVTSGNSDVFIGTYAGQQTTIGNGDVYIGLASGQSGTTAAYNTFVGAQTGVLNTTGTNNTFLGFSTGFNNTTGSVNVFVGQNAGVSNTTGGYNVAMGAAAAQGNTTGIGNVYIGYTAGEGDSTGQFNTFVGGQTGGVSGATSSNNSFFGWDAGTNNTTGQSNLFLGAYAGSNNVAGSNNIYLAANPGDESNTIRIGGSQTSTYIAGIYGVTSGSGVPVYINSNGQLGTLTSSRKYKEDIRDMGDMTDRLMKLRPVTFHYKHEYDNGPRTLQFGLIAEEVAKVYPDLVAYNPDGTPYTVRYQYLSSILLNQVQKQYHREQEQAEVIQAQQKQIDELQDRLSRIEKLLAVEDASAQSPAVKTAPAKLANSAELVSGTARD